MSEIKRVIVRGGGAHVHALTEDDAMQLQRVVPAGTSAYVQTTASRGGVEYYRLGTSNAGQADVGWVKSSRVRTHS